MLRHRPSLLEVCPPLAAKLMEALAVAALSVGALVDSQALLGGGTSQSFCSPEVAVGDLESLALVDMALLQFPPLPFPHRVLWVLVVVQWFLVQPLLLIQALVLLKVLEDPVGLLVELLGVPQVLLFLGLFVLVLLLVGLLLEVPS